MAKLFNLAEFRAEKDLTQLQLAVFLGVTREYLSMIENGKKPLSGKLFKKILNYPCDSNGFHVTEEAKEPYDSHGNPSVAKLEFELGKALGRIQEMQRAIDCHAAERAADRAEIIEDKVKIADLERTISELERRLSGRVNPSAAAEGSSAGVA